jgi:4-amino-4-deoxy-L-arabinose transferase-like glycosyltransferase
MINKQISILNAQRWLALFISLHVIAWTLAPFLMRYALPVDAMEGTIWGQHLAWGYDKDPFLNGWLTGLAIHISGTAGWGVYLFSQLSVAICFMATWELAKKMLPPANALLAVLFLEGVQYYSLHAIDFDDNTLELGIWALIILFFYKSFTEKNRVNWLMTGVFAALGMMTKYYTVMLLLPMLGFMLLTAERRKAFFSWSFFLGILAFIGIIAPHVYWLFTHDFVTVDYALQRLNNTIPGVSHLHYATVFAWQQLAAFLPVLLFLLIALMGKRPVFATFHLKVFDQQFLLMLGFGPLLLTILLAVGTGIKLRAGWGEPLLSLWGIMLLAWLPPNLTSMKFYRTLAAVFCLMVATLVGYAWALQRADEPSSANFPGNIMARSLTREWHETQHSALPYVVGPRWLAGNIAFYSPDHPEVYMECNPAANAWIDENKILQQGGIFVWDDEPDYLEMRRKMEARFGKLLGKPKVMHFSWLRKPGMKPVEISVAYLSPHPS